MNALVASLIALSLTAPGDKLIRGNLGTLIPNPDTRASPILSCPFLLAGAYASGTTSLCTPAAAISVTRSSVATYVTDWTTQTWSTAAANQIRVEDTRGVMVELANTNFAKQSETFITGDAPTAGWAASGTATYLANAANCPAGFHRITSGAGTAGIFTDVSTNYMDRILQTIDVAAPTGGTGTATIQLLASISGGETYTGTPYCWRSDDGVCTASGAGGTYTVVATATVGTTPVRLAVAATATSTLPDPPGLGMYVHAYGANMTICVRSANSYVGAIYPGMSRIVTTTTAVSRSTDLFAGITTGFAGKTNCVKAVTAYAVAPTTQYPSQTLWSVGTANATSWRLTQTGTTALGWIDGVVPATWDPYDRASREYRLGLDLSLATPRVSIWAGGMVRAVGNYVGVAPPQSPLFLGSDFGNVVGALSQSLAFRSVRLFNTTCDQAW
jgi:hypothetical protein